MNLNTINKAIQELEALEPTYQTCQKLASLYIVRDHQMSNNEASEASVTYEVDSDFMTVARRKPIGKVLTVINKHMDAIKVLYPQEYDAVIKAINKL